jgi:hypothetical protein
VRTVLYIAAAVFFLSACSSVQHEAGMNEETRQEQEPLMTPLSTGELSEEKIEVITEPVLITFKEKINRTIIEEVNGIVVDEMKNMPVMAAELGRRANESASSMGCAVYR